MSATISNNKPNENMETIEKTDESAEILYQKIGDRWYAYTILDDEVYMGSLTFDDVRTLNVKE